jgi:hypothetical protein
MLTAFSVTVKMQNSDETALNHQRVLFPKRKVLSEIQFNFGDRLHHRLEQKEGINIKKGFSPP